MSQQMITPLAFVEIRDRLVSVAESPTLDIGVSDQAANLIKTEIVESLMSAGYIDIAQGVEDTA